MPVGSPPLLQDTEKERGKSKTLTPALSHLWEREEDEMCDEKLCTRPCTKQGSHDGEGDFAFEFVEWAGDEVVAFGSNNGASDKFAR